MSKKAQGVFIDGAISTIQKNKSDGRCWSIEDANQDTVTIIDELLKYADSSVKHTNGITIINPIGTVELANLNITRPSNHIGIIRYLAGANAYTATNNSDKNLERLYF